MCIRFIYSHLSFLLFFYRNLLCVSYFQRTNEDPDEYSVVEGMVRDWPMKGIIYGERLICMKGV